MLFSLILTTAKLFRAQLQLIVTFKNHSREIMIWLSAILSISLDVILCSRVYIVAKLVSPPGWKKTLITEIISHPILMSYDLFLLISWSSWKEMCTDQHSTEKYIGHQVFGYIVKNSYEYFELHVRIIPCSGKRQIFLDI